MSASSLRGLNTFITDLRSCRTREAEEKRINKELGNIRAKFKESNLDGYSKKKYVCKLLYMHMIGWDIDFGYLEAISLISGSKYSEKQIGYLAVTLLLTENHDLLRLVINSIRKDLEDQPHEVNVCLALHAIANTGGKDLAESIVMDVLKLIFSPTANSFVRKKACLCLLRLYRRHPDAVPVVEWAPKIVGLLDDSDLGVTLASASLITTLAQSYPEEFSRCVSKATWRLHRIVIEKQLPLDSVYYKVPCPWLQVKLMRLLQYYPPTSDTDLLNILYKVLDQIIEINQEVFKNNQQINAAMAIKMEAFNLVIHLDPNHRLVDRITVLLGEFLNNNRDINIRYLGLEALTHLASVKDTLDSIKPYQETIIQSLRDKDISVRRQALDLLYGMCDGSNVVVIVNELLKFLQNSDYVFREDLALKIAILAEKFTSSYTWYVDVVIHLISSAGDQVSKEVWYRVVQIVLDHEELHTYATRQIYKSLQSPSCHEMVVRVAGYLLGEFGHLIVNDPKSAPIEQFQSLHAKFNTCSFSCRASLLNTYVKFVNLFPEIKDQVCSVLKLFTNVLDVELQQRACEYLALINMPSDDLLQVVCEEMPAFAADRESILVSRLKEKETDTEDKRTWKMTEKNRSPTSSTASPTVSGNAELQGNSVARSVVDGGSSSKNNNALIDLLGLEEPVMSATTQVSGNPLADLDPFSSSPSKGQIALPSPNSLPIPTLASLSPNWERGLSKLWFQNNGLFYDDEFIQVGVKSDFSQTPAQFTVYLGNKSNSASLGEITHRFYPLSPSLSVNIVKPGFPTVTGPLTQPSQSYEWTLLEPSDSMLLDGKGLFYQIGFTVAGGTFKLYNLLAPIHLLKFMSPVTNFSAQEFFSRWKAIGGAPKEAQVIINFGTAKNGWNGATLKEALKNLCLGVLDNVDPNPENFVCASILNSSSSRIGCLYRIEPSYEAKALRVTVKTTHEQVSATLVNLLSNILSGGI